MSKDITDELIIREETSGYSFEEENSIEEDIKILEKMIENANIENMDMNDCFGGEHIETIEHILSDYKRVLKENEEYKKAIDVVNKEKADWIKAYQEEKDKQFDLINKISSNDLIPVQKVKDKIEELKNKPLKIKQNDKYYYETDAYNKIVIQVLQELLEGKKQNV